LKDTYLKEANELLDFIEKSPSRFHAVDEMGKILSASGFQELKINEKWELKKGGKYFTTKNDSSLIAFIAGTEEVGTNGFRITGSHSDSPAIRIKPNPEMKVEGKGLKLNTEIYGGPILYSWFDRPLGFAGRVTLEGENPFKPESVHVCIKDKKCIIPSVAIHMNREVNTGFGPDKQKDMLPLLSTIEETVNKYNFKQMIAEELDIEPERIIDYEMSLHDMTRGQLVGMDEEMISCSQLDNLAMAYASLIALTESEATETTKVVVVFDNEEIGSQTMQGASSPLLGTILERITIALEGDRERYIRALENSFIISADMAHALHPNNPEKHDPTNHPVLNGGPVIKMSSNFRYTSDSESATVFELLCKKVDVPVQRFVNNSRERGGSTIGPITAGQLGMRSVDIGNPMLSMHSVKELGGVADHHYLLKVLKEFYR
jgi:aspartyl aminopeptidase